MPTEDLEASASDIEFMQRVVRFKKAQARSKAQIKKDRRAKGKAAKRARRKNR